MRLIQVGNEPNIEGQLAARGMSNDQYVKSSVEREAKALQMLHDSLSDTGIKIGPPPMAPGSSNCPGYIAPQTYFRALVQAIKAQEVAHGKRYVDWLPVHTYDFNDGTNQSNVDGSGGTRGQLGWGPAAADWYKQVSKDVLGYSVAALSTEGGASPEAAKLDKRRTEREMHETLQQIQKNANLTACLWLQSESQPGQWNRSALDGSSQSFDSSLREFEASAHH